MCVCEQLAQSLREAEWPGLEPATSWLQVGRSNHYVTMPHYTSLRNTHQSLGTNLIHEEKHGISRWVFENMPKFTDHSRTEFEKLKEISWAPFQCCMNVNQ